LIRPLARTYRGRELAATTPDAVVTWQEGEAIIRADQWDGLVLPDVPLDSPRFRIVVVHDPDWSEPLVLATTLAVLLVGRVAQGLGGALFPLAFAIIRDELPEERVAGAIGFISATPSASAAGWASRWLPDR
jgi:hypothetical protein